MRALAFALLGALAAAPLLAQELVPGPMQVPSGMPMRWGRATVAVPLGASVLVGFKTLRVTVPGVRVGDGVIVNPSAGSSLVLGVLPGASYVSADNEVTLLLTTPLSVGAALGTVNFQFVWIGAYAP